MDLSIDQRKRLHAEGESIRRKYNALQGDSPETRKQKLRLQNRYEEIDRLLGGAAARVELLAQTEPVLPAPLFSAPTVKDVSPGRIECPFCAERIKPNAEKCGSCGMRFDLGQREMISRQSEPIEALPVTAVSQADPQQRGQKGMSTRQWGLIGCSAVIACLFLMCLGAPFVGSGSTTTRPDFASKTALEQMELVFEGGFTKEQIKTLLDAAMLLCELPRTEENYQRAGSTLVALRKANGTREMDILSYMIRTLVNIPGDVKMSFPEAAGISSAFLAAGDK